MLFKSSSCPKEMVESVPSMPTMKTLDPINAVTVPEKIAKLATVASLEPRPIRQREIDVVKAVPLYETMWDFDKEFTNLMSSLSSGQVENDDLTVVTEAKNLENDKDETIPNFGISKKGVEDGPIPNPILSQRALGSNQENQDESDIPIEPSQCTSPYSKSQEHPADRFRPYQTGLWSQNYVRLILFRQANGHCFVSRTRNPNLAQWIKRQRYQYKLKSGGRHSTLTNERMKALEQIGFIWESHKASWEARFNDLCSFKEKYGHCNVPSTYSENPQLPIWVKSQRRQYKLMQAGKNVKISEERLSRLIDIGFVWSIRSPRKDTKLKKL